MTNLTRQTNWRRWLRFLCSGAANTLFTYVVYLVLIQILPYQGAYLSAYVAGIIFAYWLNSTFVFKVPMSWKGLFAYPIVYLVQYLLAASLLELLVTLFGLRPAYAPLLITVALLPLTYLMNKLVLKRRSVRA